MKKGYKFQLIFFFLIVAIIFLIVWINPDFFEQAIKEKIGVYGLLGLFVFSFLVDSVQQLFGPETPIAIAYLSGFNILGILFIALLGAYSGSLAAYYFGKKVLHKKIKKICQEEKNKKYCNYLNKYGKPALVLAAVTPLPYPLFCWLSFSFGIRLKDFIIYALIPRTLRVVGVLLFISWIF